MWSFLTDSASGTAAKTLTHRCADVPWGFQDADSVLHEFSPGEDVDDMVDCTPRYPELLFMRGGRADDLFWSL